MRAKKRQALENAGWRVGTADEFLGLTEEESAFLDVKLSLAQELRTRRVKRRWTQTHLAHRLNSSQSRVAKMEAADPSVSVDLLVRGLLAMGLSRQQIARAVGRDPESRAA
jgi:ribosome-binding protein aMBF1 (putative translation factor)